MDLIQNFIRRFAFQVCGIPPEIEVRGDRPVPPIEVAIICIDGLDIVTRPRLEHGAIRQINGIFIATKTAGQLN